MTNTEVAKPAHERQCPECGGIFTTNHPTKRFCSPAHKQAYANREAAQGKVIVSLVKAVRHTRGATQGDKATAKAARSELERIIDMFNAEDKAAGRPAATVYVKSLLGDGFQYIDRKRR